MKMFSKRIKLPEMAKLLSRSAKQFRRDVANHEIPHLRLGRTKLFDAIEVFEFLSRQTRESSEFSKAGKVKLKKQTLKQQINFDEQKEHYKDLLKLS